mgnify:CR=1 FL=1
MLNLIFNALKKMALIPLLTLATTVGAAELPLVKIASDPSSQPFAYMDLKTKKMTGFDIDLVNALAKIAGFRVENVPIDFAGIIPALQSGSVEAAASSFTITDQRKKVIDFSVPYYDSGLQILVRDNEQNITSMNSLIGKKVAALTGATGYTYTKEKMGNKVNLVPYSTNSDAFLALLSGSVDAVITDKAVLDYYSKHGGQGKAKVVGPIYHGEKFGVAFAKGSHWVVPVNNAFAKIKADGTLGKIYQKWFGAPVPADI